MQTNYLKVAADAARHEATAAGVALACPWCRTPVDAAEAKEHEHMHAVCRTEFRLNELERKVDAQEIVIARLKRQVDGAWQGAA